MKLSRRDLIKAFALGAAGLMLPKGVIADEPIKRYWQGVSLLPPQPTQGPDFSIGPSSYGEIPFGIHASDVIPDNAIIMTSGQIVGIAINRDYIMYHRDMGDNKYAPATVMQSGLLSSPWVEQAAIEGPISAGDFVALGSDGKLRRADPNSYAILRGLGG